MDRFFSAVRGRGWSFPTISKVLQANRGKSAESRKSRRSVGGPDRASCRRGSLVLRSDLGEMFRSLFS